MRTRYFGIVNFATRRRVTIAMIAIGVVVFGLVAQGRLPVTLLPDVEHPSLSVQTELEGAAPEEVEYLISRPLEETLATTTGVRRVDSISRAGQSEITLEFEWGTAMDTALIDVRERLGWAALPLEADTPQVLRFDPSSDPIVRLSLSDDGGDLGSLRRYAEDEIAREIEVLPGVAAARVSGGLDEEIQVRVDDERMAALDLDIADIRDRIEAENVNVSGGQLRDGSRDLLVRTLNRFEDLDDLRRMAVDRRNGTGIRLEDIAEVGMGHKDPDAILRLDGEEAVEIAMYREGDANTVQVAREIRTELADIESRLPEGMEVATIQDQSRFIERAISEVITAGVLGGLLAALMLYLFLGRVRPTLIIAVSIPLSVLGTFLLMHGTGIGLNVMSLGGIALAVGLLVDSAIVVLESISRRREAGDDPLEAARRGAGEVGAAITASTLTTIAVFLPLAFVEGLAGQLFGDQALAITFALLLALLIALAVIPMLSVPSRGPAEAEGEAAPRRKGLRGLPGRLFNGLLVAILAALRIPARMLASLGGWLMRPVRAGFNAVWQRIDGAYPRLLAWSLDRPGRIWLSALAVVAIALAVLPRLGTELMPQVSQGEFDLVLEMAPGTDLERTDQTLESLRRELDEALPVAATATMAGSGDRLDASPADEGENRGRLTVRMEAWAGTEEEAATADALRRVLADRDDLRYRIETPAIMRFDQPLELHLHGDQLEDLERASEQARVAMAESKHFSDVRSSMAEGYPEVRIDLDRELLARFDLDAAGAAQRIADHVQGQTASRYSLPDRELDIHVRGREETRRSLDALRALPMNPMAEASLPLEAVAALTIETGPAEIRREGQRRVAVVAADPAHGDTGRAAAALDTLLTDLELPAGMHASVGGQSTEMDEAFAALMLALLLSIFLVYLVMASQFESLLHPFVILFTVPMALAGAIIGLWLSGSTLSVIVFIGLMMLGGIIVNNAIVLVDRINRQRREGLALREAIMEAGRTRLRPIVMTAATTILALLPMALGFGDGGELRAPMAITVIGGLLAGTLLTLVVIPVSYYRIERLRGADS